MKRKKIEKIKVRRRKTKKGKKAATKKFEEKVLSGEVVPTEMKVWEALEK